MKITCPSCSARYSIDDAKVKGKAFKFTCKKCGQTHVYRDSPDGAAAVPAAAPAGAPVGAAPPAAGDEEEAVWFVAVGEEQQGPYTTQQIREYIQTDQLDPESFMWKEGMEDWLPVQQIQEFADGYQGAAPAAAARAPAPDSPFGGQLDDGVTVASPFATAAHPQGDAGDLFAFGGAPSAAAKTPGAPADPSPFGAFGGGGAAAVASRGGADLFGAPAQPSPFENTGEERDEDVMMGAAGAAAASPRVDARQMIGQRNENSVLFSLSSLQALGAGKPAPAAAAATSAAPRAGFATGEGSGLIDIRAMAGAVVRTEERHDDLFGLGAGGGIGAPVAVPILTRPIRHDDESKKPMFLLIGVIGAFAVAIVILLVFLLRGKDEKPVPAQTVVIADAGNQGMTEEEIQERIAAAIVAAQADAAGQSPVEEKDGGSGGDAGTEPDAGAADTDPNAKTADGGPDGGEEPEPGGDGGRNPPRRDTGRNPVERDTGGTGPVPPPPRDSGSSTEQRDSRMISSLEGLGRRDAGSSPSSDLSETPDRNAVKRQLDSVKGAIGACAGGQAGTANVAITIQGSTGRVTRVNVTGDFQGAAATCIGNAIRGLTFPQFSNASQAVNYSYRF